MKKCNLLSQSLQEGLETFEAFSPQKNIQHSNHEISTLLSIFVGHFYPHGSGSSRHPKSMRILTDPDPQHWQELYGTVWYLLFRKFSARLVGSASEYMHGRWSRTPRRHGIYSYLKGTSRHLDSWGRSRTPPPRIRLHRSRTPGPLYIPPPNGNSRCYLQKVGWSWGLKGLSHEIDFKNFDKNLQNLD